MPHLNNYEIALRAERKRVSRCFQRFTSEQRANHATSFRLGPNQRNRVGEYFYTHPSVPEIAFPSRDAAARAALVKSEGQYREIREQPHDR